MAESEIHGMQGEIKLFLDSDLQMDFLDEELGFDTHHIVSNKTQLTHYPGKYIFFIR